MHPRLQEPEAKEAAAPEAAEVTEVIWACYNLGEERNKTLGDMEVASNDVLQGERVKLVITPPGTNLWEKLQTEFAGGQSTYDIVVNQINWVQVGAARGMFASLDEQMARDKIAREEYPGHGVVALQEQALCAAVPGERRTALLQQGDLR